MYIKLHWHRKWHTSSVIKRLEERCCTTIVWLQKEYTLVLTYLLVRSAFITQRDTQTVMITIKIHLQRGPVLEPSYCCHVIASVLQGCAYCIDDPCSYRATIIRFCVSLCNTCRLFSRLIVTLCAPFGRIVFITKLESLTETNY